MDQEHNGIIRNGAKLLFAYAEATVPKASVCRVLGVALKKKHASVDCKSVILTIASHPPLKMSHYR